MNFENISTDDGTILVKTARKAVTRYLTNHKKISDPIFDEKFSFSRHSDKVFMIEMSASW